MNVIGVVAEYNPFHLGHAYQIQQAKTMLEEDNAVVAVMSGNFVQRGEAAMFPKQIRAEAAVRCGCDLVLELPLPWAVSSAEGFARGGAGLLCALGVDAISFGSESGELAAIQALAETLLRPETNEQIRAEMKQGGSFAAVRQTVLARLLGAETADRIADPNDLLAVEYCKTILQYRPQTRLLPVLRKGAAHDAMTESGFRSASALRKVMREGGSLRGLVPDAAAEIYESFLVQKDGMTQERLEQAMLSRLRQLDAAAFAALPDAGEGLENRLARACAEGGSLDEIYAMAKTKRYAMSRIRRMTLCAALGIRKGMADGIPPYARVLAANAKGRTLLRQWSDAGVVPILTKPAAVRGMPERAQAVFALESAATDVYALGYTNPEYRRGGSEWRSGPVMR